MYVVLGKKALMLPCRAENNGDEDSLALSRSLYHLAESLGGQAENWSGKNSSREISSTSVYPSKC